MAFELGIKGSVSHKEKGWEGGEGPFREKIRHAVGREVKNAIPSGSFGLFCVAGAQDLCAEMMWHQPGRLNIGQKVKTACML